MPAIRHLRYLTALAREQHFARAAAACNVTQPTLSSGIKQLEACLGVLIFERGHRFIGLTPEGERVLEWARRTLDGFHGLRQEIGVQRGALSGELRLGVIPSMMPVVALVTEALLARHPAVRVTVLSMSSDDIQRQLDEFSIDAGLTYLQESQASHRRTEWPLYREYYTLIARDTVLTRAGKDKTALPPSIGWEEVAALPLCLLTEDMQNRRILDDLAYLSCGRRLSPSVQASSLLALVAHLQAGHRATILPHPFKILLSPYSDLHFVPISESGPARMTGLAVVDRDPQPPVARALLELMAGGEVAAALHGLFDSAIDRSLE